MTGTVKWFSREKGYGFIIGEDGNEVFIHHTNINMKGFRSLHEDDRVSYEIGEGNNGRTQAVNVKLLLTMKMIESALKKEGLYVKDTEDALGNRGYMVVNLDNVIQTSADGMSFDELAEYAGITEEA